MRRILVHPALGDFLEVVHKVLAVEREDLQIVAEKIRGIFGTRIQDVPQQAVEIVENSAAVEARSAGQITRIHGKIQKVISSNITMYFFLNLGGVNINENLECVYRHVTAFSIRYWDRTSSSALKISLRSSNSASVSALFTRLSVRFIAVSSLVPATRNSLFNTVAAISEQRLFKMD